MRKLFNQVENFGKVIQSGVTSSEQISKFISTFPSKMKRFFNRKKVQVQAPKAKEEITYEVEKVKKEIRKRQNWKLILPDPELKRSLIEQMVIIQSLVISLLQRALGFSQEAIHLALEELEQFETKETSFNVADVVSNYCIFHVDGIIPSHLRNSLEHHLSALAKEHPSGEKVQDLIDPSLFPYIEGTTLTYDDINNGNSKKSVDISTSLDFGLKDRWGRVVGKNFLRIFLIENRD